MRRRNKVIAFVAVVLLALGALALALPALAAGALERKLEGALARRELEGSWREVEVSWSGALELRELSLNDPERGVALEIARVSIVPTLDSVLDGEPKLERVRVEGVEATIDADRLREALEARGEEPDKAPDAAAGSTLAKLKRALLEDPPTIAVARAQLHVARGDAPHLDVTIDRARFDVAEQRWLLSAVGSLTPTHERLPGVLKGTHTWGAEGTLSLASRELALKLTPGEEGERFALEVPMLGAAGVREVSLDLAMGEARRVELGARGAHLRLGGEGAKIAAATIDEVTLDLSGARPALRAAGATLQVTPSRLGELERIRDRLSLASSKDLLERGKAALARRAGPRARRSQQLMSAASRVSGVLGRVDVTIEDSTIEAQLRLDTEELRRVELVRELEILGRAGRLEASGAASGGAFSANVSWLPGQPLPVAASLRAAHVDIAKLPGIAQGRTLPNRGVRGKLGGIVDLEVHLMTPPTGLDSAGAFEEVTLLTHARWRDGMIDLHGLANAPLTGLELEARATTRWRPGINELSVEEGELRYNGLVANYEASLRDWPLDPMLRAKAWVPEEVECQAMIDALPDALLGPYREVKLSGEAAPSLSIKYPLNAPHRLKLELDGLAEEDTPEFRRKRRREGLDPLTPIHKNYFCKIDGLHADREGWPEVELAAAPGSAGQAPPKATPPRWRHPSARGDVYWLNKPFIKRVTEGVSEDAEVYVGPGLKTYVPLSELPPWVAGAAYLSEEILFYSNRGVSAGLIQKALRIDFERGRFVYGGSTVTQQLVKNLFLTREKTLARKLQEALVSLRIDEVVSKDRVIELYLNCIEFGPDLYGIGPAARHYFNKDARDLTPIEAVFLAIIKPSPSYGEHLRKRGKLPTKGWFPKRINTIFKRMVEYKVMTAEEAEAARPYTVEWEDGVYVPREPPPEEQLEVELFDFDE